MVMIVGIRNAVGKLGRCGVWVYMPVPSYTFMEFSVHLCLSYARTCTRKEMVVNRQFYFTLYGI